MNVVVELTGGFCNSRCVWCFTTYKCEMSMKRGLMSPDNVKQFLRLNDGFAFDVIPFGHGEALLNPRFVECCRMILESGRRLASIHTNLAMDVSNEKIDVLSKFGKVVVNVGGATEETHFENTGTSLKKVLSNVEQLLKRQHGSVEIKMVVNHRNYEEKQALCDIGRNLNVPVGFFPIYFGPSDSDNDDCAMFVKQNLMMDDGSIDKRIECRDNVELDDGVWKVAPASSSCYGLITTVRWHGGVNVCCRVRYDDGIVGDAFAMPLSEILRSEKYGEARRLGLKRQYVEYCKYCS